MGEDRRRRGARDRARQAPRSGCAGLARLGFMLCLAVLALTLPTRASALAPASRRTAATMPASLVQPAQFRHRPRATGTAVPPPLKGLRASRKADTHRPPGG